MTRSQGFHDSSPFGKESASNAGDPGAIPGSGRPAGEGLGYPLQYSGLENSMNCIVHAVAELDVTKPTFTFKEKQWSESTLIRRDSLWPLHLLSTPSAIPRVLVVHYTQSSQAAGLLFSFPPLSFYFV